jgi:hypothetical protein
MLGFSYYAVLEDGKEVFQGSKNECIEWCKEHHIDEKNIVHVLYDA